MVMQNAVAETYVSPAVVDYIVALIHATRQREQLLRGASPRATLSVTAMAKAIARLQGRDYVVPKDVQEVFAQTVEHRLLIAPKAEALGITALHVLQDILQTVPAPKVR